jgi:hypothetical protein
LILSASWCIVALLASWTAATESPATRPGTTSARATQPSYLRGLLPTSRPDGWQLVEGRWVKAEARVTFAQLARFSVVGGKLEARLTVDPRLRSLMRNGRQTILEVDSSDWIWQAQMAGQTWINNRTGVSRHLSARGMRPLGPLPKRLQVSGLHLTPQRIAISGVGWVSGRTIQVNLVTFDQQTRLQVYSIDAGPPLRLMFQARDLATLAAEHPREARRFVSPLLRQLTGDNLLHPGAGDVYRVFDSIQPPPGVVRRTRQLLDQLSEASFREREEASAALTAMGRSAILALSRMDRSDLDPEQVARVDELMSGAMTDRNPADLRRDPVFLLMCVEDPDPLVRAEAMKQLGVVLGREVPIDPMLRDESLAEQVDRMLDRLHDGR